MNVGDSIRWLPEEPKVTHRLYIPGTRVIFPKYESSDFTIAVG